MDIDWDRKNRKENPEPPEGAVAVKLKNGFVEWVADTDHLFRLHFGLDVVHTLDYIDALGALRRREVAR
jgi:hypothetical protein